MDAETKLPISLKDFAGRKCCHIRLFHAIGKLNGPHPCGLSAAVGHLWTNGSSVAAAAAAGW